MESYDITIIGAGPIGAALALALSPLPLRIALLEANPLSLQIKPEQDSRALALTYSSTQILKEIDVWPALSASATPIQTVHISDRGHFGFTRIKAQQENVPALGYVVPAYTLATELNKALFTGTKSFTILNPAKVKSLQPAASGWHLTVETETGNKDLHSQLIIAADGTHSTIRSLLGITVTAKEYAQSALVTTITLARDHGNTAYERFLANGALAMLPMQNMQCGCVWTAPHAAIKTLLHLADEDFLQQLQMTFGYRLGKILTIGKRYTYPLKMIYANEQVRPGFVLMGNAAHTLHPIAAQGFNLGLGDAAALAKVLVEANHMGKNLSDLQLLESYVCSRQKTVAWIMRFTDQLTRFFAYEFMPLTVARDMGLLAIDLLPSLKHRLAKRLMGSFY